MKIVFLFTTLLLSSSCSFIHYMGTKEVVDKSKSDIDHYLLQNKVLYSDYNLLLKDELIDSLSTKKHAVNLWQYEHGTKQSTIQLRIYDSVGKLVNAYVQCYGEFKKLNILAEKPFKTFSNIPLADLQFNDNLELWSLTESEVQEILTKASEKKYTFVIYWNIWSNYYSRVMLKELRKYLKKYQMKDEVLIILVNTDFSKKN